MTRRELLGAAASVPLFANQTQPEVKSPAPQPNVIWLLGDQHRAQALSCAEDPNARTPNIDVLARTGVHFTNAVSGMPLCCPFRGSMLTGRYPHQCVPGHEHPLPAGQPTITQPLKAAGYATAYFGKWHLDGFHESDGRAAMHIVPPDRRGGFDVWTGYENNNSQWDTWVHGGAGQSAFHYRLPGYEADELTKLFISYLKDRGAERRAGQEKPFFAVLSVQPPHDPFVAPAEYMHYNAAQLQLRPNVPVASAVNAQARRELAGYYAQIENWDANIGRIRSALDEQGLTHNTHIMLFSDHGEMGGSHGQFRKMTPYEEALRIPFIISGGQQAEYQNWHTGQVNHPLNHVDIAPTTLGLCGVSKPSWMAGQDYSALRRGTPLPAKARPDSAFIQSVIPTMHGNSVNKPWRGVVTRDGWKYACFDGVSWLLFNLNDDPYEQVNLAHNQQYASERKALIARLRQWIADTGDRFSVPDN